MRSGLARSETVEMKSEREPLVPRGNGIGRREGGAKTSSHAPDGPLAWIVATANFLINLFVVGLGRMSGILYVVFMEIFHSNRTSASIPFSVQQAARNLFGPLAGILGQKYGVRNVTIAGGFIGAVSAAACFFAKDIEYITLMWGLVFGICTALTTTLNQVTIDQYFVKYRTTAGGFAFSGGCVGAFVFPIVLEYLISRYGMSGTFLVMGGIILNVVPAALLLVDPPWKKNSSSMPSEEVNKQETANKEKTINYSTFRRAESKPNKNGAVKAVDFTHLRENSETVYQLFSLTIPPDVLLQDSMLESQWPVIDTLPIVTELEKLHKFLIPSPKRPTVDNGSIINEITRDIHTVKVREQTKSDDVSESEPEDTPSSNDDVRFEDNPRWLFMTMKLRELFDKEEEEDIFSYFPHQAHDAVTNVLKTLKELNDLVVFHEKPQLSDIPPRRSPQNVDDTMQRLAIQKRSKKTHSNSFLDHMKTAILLHKNPIFLLICLCRGVFMLTFIPMVTIIVDFAMDKGLHRDTGKYIIATLSLGDLLGRLCLGWVTDSGCLSLPRYMVVAMVILGVSTGTLPMMHSELSLMPAVLIFGMLQGSLFIRHQTLVSQYMDRHEQTISMGFINLLSGILGFILPYYIGYFRDTLGSYDKMFYINGGICVGIGLIWILEPFLARFTSKDILEYDKLPGSA